MSLAPQEHPIWDYFVRWAIQNDIDLHQDTDERPDNPDDWMPWWRCFLAGWETT